MSTTNSPSAGSASEREIQAKVLLAIGSRPDIRLWRSNSGRVFHVNKPCSVCRAHGYWVELSPPGTADLIGIQKPTGRLIGIEVKTATGPQNDQQKAWQAMVTKFGGVYVLARSVEDAERALL